MSVPHGSEATALLALLAQGTPERPVPLGRYDVVGCLGSGGMGTVYDAVDRGRGTRVALKTLQADDAGAAVGLKREFRAVADLAHPNLATVYELACEQGLWFFVMERIEGERFSTWARGRTAPVVAPEAMAETATLDTASLADMLPESGMTELLPPPATSPPSCGFDALRGAVAELVRGLAALHDAGLRHGDVKPANVLVCPDGRVVIVDFGLATPVSGAPRRGSTGGTPQYMAPEHLADAGAGPPADWYAVGTLVYEALTGRLPFLEARVRDLWFVKTHCRPPEPRELVPDVPRDLSELCMALLEPDPAARPSGHDLLRRLDGATAPRRPARHRAFVGRQRELGVLHGALARARGGSRTVVHVHGPSGIGKSSVVRSFLESADGLVLRGRCYERESVPYKGIDGIVDELADVLRSLDEAAVRRLLPEGVADLARAFPALLSVPAVAAAEPAQETGSALEARRRTWAAMTALCAALACSRPLTLWIDDLQWADADSARLLEALIDGTAGAALLVVASFRRPEALANPALQPALDASARLPPGTLVELEVGGLAEPDAIALARATLAGLRAPDTLAGRVAREAGGVPLFVEELARFVARSGAPARLSLEEAIAARVAALPAAQRTLMEVVAVADSPVPQSVVFEAAALDAAALPELLALRSASLVRWHGAGADDPVAAYHDRVRESVYGSLSAAARQGHHLRLGRALAARRPDGGPGLFDAARHLLAADDLLSDPAERVEAARLHLLAGRKARSAGAFPLAFGCFEGGIALLPPGAWEAEYDLALGLHGGAAEAAYLSAEWAALDARVADVKARARTAMDQLGAREVEIDALAGRHRYAEAIDRGMEALALFGVTLPRDPGQAELAEAFQAALDALTRVGPEALEAMPDVEDPEVLAAMRIQVRLSPVAYFGRPPLLPVMASNLIVTSVERGLSTATPYALALFGIVLNTVGMLPVAHAWGQLAVRLLDRWEDRSLEAATRHVVFNLVCAWMAPLHTILEPLRAVFAIGRRTGDLEYASYAAHGYAHNAMYAARPLRPLLAEAREISAQMQALGQVNALHVHQPFVQVLAGLVGELADPARLDGDGFDEGERLAQAEAAGSRSGVFIVRLAMGLARAAFGRFDEAHACFEVARAHLDAAPSVWHVPILHQTGALAACRARGDSAALRATAEASLEALRTLAGHAPVNFAHRVSLVEGELLRLGGDVPGALERFGRAIEQAGAGGWRNDVALAHELVARCHPDPVAAVAALAAARAGYAAWGAAGKAAALDALSSPGRLG